MVVADYQVITDRDRPVDLPERRTAMVLDYLACGIDADVVALQEVWTAGGTTQAHVLGDALGLHATFAGPSLPPPPDPPAPPVPPKVRVAARLNFPPVAVDEAVASPPAPPPPPMD